MSFFKRYAVVLFAVLITGALDVEAQSAIVPQLGKSTVKEVIAAMTLEEKATLLVGTGRAPRPKPAPGAKPGVSNGFVPAPPMIGQTEVKVPGAAGNTAAIPRLGIPSMVLSDGPAGVRISPIRNRDSSVTYYATAFPVGTLLASTWDPAVVNAVGKAFGNEVKEYGVDILLAPGVNIHRNPLNGRNFEYYSEDPLVAGTMAGAIINGIQSNGVGTSIKHFIANNQETSRNFVNSIVSERALRELYLKVFRIAIASSNPWTVMSSYNKLNGTYTAQRYDLLTTVLRNEWNFKGFVMTDWGGGYDWIAEMNAGNDLIMPGRPDQIETLVNAVKHDSLNVKVLDQNVEHMLNIILKSPAFSKYPYSNKPDLKAHAEVSRKAATEGMILLKNQDSALPISKSVKTVAAFGNASYNTIAGGTGSGDVNKAYTISVYQGLANAGYVPNESLKNSYTKFFQDTRAHQMQQFQQQQQTQQPNSQRRFFGGLVPEMAVSDSLINETAKKADLAIITIGRNAGEGSDRKLETNYNLTSEEKQQFKKIADVFHAKGKKVIAVLNIGGVIDMNEWQDYANAILLSWQPGQEAGNAIADVLSGKVNPSGKLATTFPVKYADVPSAKNFPGTPVDKPEQVIYQEGIYVGYRYYDSFNVKPMYEFGYGLSYTNFAISNLKINSPLFNGMITATVNIKNTGKIAGKEVVQIYVSAPTKTIEKPMQELKTFGKTRLLQPGESQTLTFTLHAADLASYHTDSSEWITDAGKYVLKAGVSSRDIKQTTSFSIPKTIRVEKVHKVLQPEVRIEEFKVGK
ncbi:glycoside hydrolase family 3 C-terminal domain-containing protein [Mucilaginibacter arboris]|uniref:Beta-glucosidase n=1 Tax=Mucilaginibacter arboris TaxID=2682090 RepID=A0A7K1SZS1_9SPHI|nr:glycoside hydrolase family 3 C-terminal domain-containing protein [Mucilaginibacter arboris]MVN22809.1 beta-glucosidase [Mucilaginibacter arboris]